MSSFGRPLIQPVLQFFDSNGNPLAGGSLSTYAAGTSTPQATYSDSALSTPLPNPITLNSQGMPQTGAGSVTVIYLSANSYKFVLADSGGTTIWTADNIGGSINADAAGSTWLGAVNGTTGAFSGAMAITGNTTVGGTLAVTGITTVTADVRTVAWTDYSSTSTITGWQASGF